MKILHLSVLLVFSWGSYSAYSPPACRADTYQRLTVELARNRRLWHSKKIKNYRYQLKVDCFCDLNMAGPFQTRVRNGVLKSMSFNHNYKKYVKMDKETSADMLAYSSMDKIFNKIQSAIQQRIAHIAVTYDPHWGYPTQVVINPYVPDADRELSVSRFEILK